jgi:pimeloyl-ACP methyl ester carboxylesterase
VWDSIRAATGRADTIALALPGFDAPLPDAWVASKERYVDWIVAELEAIGEPVDLVGHDWGCLLAQRVVSTRPDLIRTWACGGGPVDESYVWHDTAQAWQTPELGEQIMAMMTPELLATALAPEIGEAAAAAMAAAVDDAMKQCILDLYRSAITVGDEWQGGVDQLGARVPAAIIWGRDDVYAPPIMGERLAARVGGSLHLLDCGHFWPVVQPAAAAAVLSELWTK